MEKLKDLIESCVDAEIYSFQLAAGIGFVIWSANGLKRRRWNRINKGAIRTRVSVREGSWE
jgi:hypothetical protein